MIVEKTLYSSWTMVVTSETTYCFQVTSIYIFLPFQALTSRGRILLGNIITSAIEESPRHFVESEDSLPCSQESAIGPYPKPDESNPHPNSKHFPGYLIH